MSAPWKSIILQQLPYKKVSRYFDQSLDCQEKLISEIRAVQHLLSGKYMEAFLRGFFRDAVVFDDELMSYYLRCSADFPTHSTLHFALDKLEYLSIQSSSNFVENGTTGATVWDASVALSEYILENRMIFKGKRVLELGSGTGMAGLVASKCETDRVVLSDLAFVLEKFTRKNANGNVDLLELDWRYPEGLEDRKFDIAIAADVIFDPEVVPCLVDLLYTLKDCAIIIAQKVRNPDTFSLFLSILTKKKINFTINDAKDPTMFFYEPDSIKFVTF